ncbi:molybdenum ABC transporter ATP-binding protein [Microbulbifer halophilus]|uniref:Molybdenum ABC transporter ATP-binding protein n=1 Tax=Microbulbifer halophilus TaxID=453963 RepID=A0ABW5EEZ2_9GAMM|nr:molybdenum ABC transporter ATP-binding protein [Microbulbifer halophilus]MCW8125982.1 molybdenum ABC transporter ATP-binding protein [Microbulbifer halophilus]
MAVSDICAGFRLSFPDFSLDIDTRIPARGITAIFGQSGSGKTTLLRCIAGLQQCEWGRLVVRGETWQGERIFLPTHRRPLGYVFQESSLLAHLSAEDNLQYALRRARPVPPRDLYWRVVALMGIGPLLQRYPQQLSGGERQRVAIARALLVSPQLLLMDEPLASLDAARKREILPYLERLRSEFELPILYVSHSIDEVARLADHLLVLDRGRLAASGALAEVLGRLDLPPGLGEDTGVVLEGRVVERDARWGLARVAFAGGELWLRDSGDAPGQHLRVRVLARDVSLALASHGDTSILNRLPATVAEVAPDADSALVLVRLRLEGEEGESGIVARLTRRSADHLQLVSGKKVWAQIKSAAIVK